MPRKTNAELKAAAQADLKVLQERIAKLESEEAARIGKLAIKAGLSDLDLDDDAMLAALQKFVSSFREGKALKAVKVDADTAENSGA